MHILYIHNYKIGAALASVISYFDLMHCILWSRPPVAIINLKEILKLCVYIYGFIVFRSSSPFSYIYYWFKPPNSSSGLTTEVNAYSGGSGWLGTGGPVAPLTTSL